MFKTKLPYHIRALLADEMRSLFSGTIETLNIKVSLTIPIKIGYGWAEDDEASYNQQEDLYNYGLKVDSIVDKSISSKMKIKLARYNVRIKNFYKKLDLYCKRYNTMPDEEFSFINREFKLYNCSKVWN